MTKLPDSIFDLERFHIDWSRAKYEVDYALNGWRLCFVIEHLSNGVRVIYADESGERFEGYGFIPVDKARQMLRPRVEKRRVKGWVLIYPGSTSFSRVTHNQGVARQWTFDYADSGASIVPFETDEFVDGERPTFEEPKADEPRRFKVGDRVKCIMDGSGTAVVTRVHGQKVSVRWDSGVRAEGVWPSSDFELVNEQPVELKPGMRVRVRKPANAHDRWDPEMNALDGTVQTVESVSSLGLAMIDGWTFHPDWLTPITEDEK